MAPDPANAKASPPIAVRMSAGAARCCSSADGIATRR
jgi:hypothetical protein